MINWKEIRDRHQEGITPFGKVWIRFNEDGKASAGYLCFGSTKKIVPWSEDEGDDADVMRLRLEEEVETLELKKELNE
jgi:hypothetical protein